MNEIFCAPDRSVPASAGTTMADDGHWRRAWTSADVQHMIEAGIIEHGEPFELIGGELVAMAARARADDIRIGSETPLRLDEHNEPEPEFIVYPRGLKPGEVRGGTVLLVVEIADSSLSLDHKVKVPLYVRFGAREAWVINARSLETTVYREPGASGFARAEVVKGEQLLQPLLAPSLAVRLADLEHES